MAPHHPVHDRVALPAKKGSYQLIENDFLCGSLNLQSHALVL
jgi:hypothetical protein